MFKKRFEALLPWILVACFISYMALSWIVLFRDKRALAGISSFYPQLETFMYATRDLLLQNNLNTLPTFFFIIVSVIAVYCYLRALAMKFSLRKILIFASVFQVLLFLSYPILSTDIFYYILSDRIATVYDQNVWTIKPLAYPNDPFFKLADWVDQTKIYGFVNQMIYNPASYLGGNDLLLQVLLHKLVVWIFVIASTFLIYKGVRKYYPGKENFALLLILWNPLFVLETVGSGHNDILMIFFVILCYLFFKQKKYALSGAWLAFAAGVKITPVFLLPFLVTYLLQKKQWSGVASLVLIFSAVTGTFFYLMGVDPLAFIQRIAYSTNLYWQSLQYLIHRFYENEKIIFTIMQPLLIGTLAVIQYRKKLDPFFVYGIFLLVYLLFVVTAYWNWYVLWLVLLLPFIQSISYRAIVLAFSFSSLFAYPLLWLSQRFGYGHILWQFVIYFFIIAIPIATYLLLTYNPRLFSAIARRLGFQFAVAGKAKR